MKFVKTIVRDLLAAVAKVLLLQRMATCTAGAGSRVNFWRVRPRQGGVLKIGSRTLVRAEMVFERDGAVIEIGDRTFVGRGLFTIADRLVIGDDVQVSWNVTIADHDSHSLKFSERCNDVEMNAFQGIKIWDCVNISPVTIKNKA